MCDSIYSATISHKYNDNIINIHKFGPTPCKLNPNPLFISSKTIMCCRNIKKEHTFKNKYKLYVNSSNGSDFSSEMSLKEEDKLGLELSSDNENGDSLQDYMSLNREKDVNDVDEALKEKAKAKDGVLNGDEVVEVKLKRKQLMKRSNLIAKQVIGVQSAFSLGFVSQLWVDTASWVVLEVEVRPSLLSSESGKVLLEDIKRVGDVVLVQDETFVLNEFRTVGLETLVGYSVVTRGGRKLGKVRGYTFNINSGAVESLELDAFGYSIIPSSLVTTYALFTEDVLQVISDTIVVHETAASRIQRLTKGLLSMMNPESSKFKSEYDDQEEESRRPVKRRNSRKKSSKRKSHTGSTNYDDDLDLPMDYM